MAGGIGWRVHLVSPFEQIGGVPGEIFGIIDKNSVNPAEDICP